MKNLLKGRILLLMIFVLGAGILYFANINVGNLSRINALQTELKDEKQKNVELNNKLNYTERRLQNEISELEEKLKTADAKLTNLPQIQQYEIEELKKKGLKDPVRELKQDLMKRTDLIPYEAVLGGTMGFCTEDSIHIISSKWAAANFEDGHINGVMLLKYNILKDGRIRWYVMDSILF